MWKTAGVSGSKLSTVCSGAFDFCCLFIDMSSHDITCIDIYSRPWGRVKKKSGDRTQEAQEAQEGETTPSCASCASCVLSPDFSVAFSRFCGLFSCASSEVTNNDETYPVLGRVVPLGR